MAFLLIDLYNQYIRPYIYDELSEVNIHEIKEVKPDIENDLHTIVIYSDIDKSGPSYSADGL
jgi:hypothetical protein